MHQRNQLEVIITQVFGTNVLEEINKFKQNQRLQMEDTDNYYLTTINDYV